jgi:hypothetical protein
LFWWAIGSISAGEIGLGIEAVELGALQHGIEDRRTLAAGLGAEEQEVFARGVYWPNLGQNTRTSNEPITYLIDKAGVPNRIRTGVAAVKESHMGHRWTYADSIPY